MKEFPPLMLMKGPLLELSLRGILVKNISQNLSQTAMNLQRNHLKIWPKNVCLTLRYFCCFGKELLGKEQHKRKVF